MKTKTLIILSFLLCTCVSCIQDEPLSPYADIEAFALPAGVTISDATINQENITVFVRKDSELSSIVPAEIKISEGATIDPSANTPRDFSQPVTYTVTAADGHQRIYTVQSVKTAIYKYDFEHWTLDGTKKYEVPVEYDADGTLQALWDSGNKGVNIYKKYDTPEEYPVHKTTDAVEGGAFAAEMITQEGPPKGLTDLIGVKIPIVAGSLFTGVFKPLDALKDPLYATQFGQPFYDKPIRFTGKYKYTAGSGEYIAVKRDTVNGKKVESVITIPNVKDSCSVYAIFYKSDENLERLDGTNVLTHPNVVALAMLPPEARAGSKGDGFVSFDLTFDYKNSQEVDFTKNNYKLGIVLSSSFYGDRYEGVIGSHLIVDDLEIFCEGEDDSNQSM